MTASGASQSSAPTRRNHEESSAGVTCATCVLLDRALERPGQGSPGSEPERLVGSLLPNRSRGGPGRRAIAVAMRFRYVAWAVIALSLGCIPGKSQDWGFVQSVGGIALGVPYRTGTGIMLPVTVDVSGLKAITTQPTTPSSPVQGGPSARAGRKGCSSPGRHPVGASSARCAVSLSVALPNFSLRHLARRPASTRPRAGSGPLWRRARR